MDKRDEDYVYDRENFLYQCSHRNPSVDGVLIEQQEERRLWLSRQQLPHTLISSGNSPVAGVTLSFRTGFSPAWPLEIFLFCPSSFLQEHPSPFFPLPASSHIAPVQPAAVFKQHIRNPGDLLLQFPVTRHGPLLQL